MRSLFLLAALASAALAFCQGERSTFPAHRFTTPPTIDGTIDTSGEWASVPSASGLFDENTGQPDPEQMQWWLGYDERFIYFAARVTLHDPKAVKATEYRTNVSLSGDDFVGIGIDPFGNLNDINHFEINPRGATNVRIPGGRAAKREWLGEFNAKGRLTETGFEVEARIPWAVMRLPNPGKRNLRVLAYRVSSQTQRSYVSNDIANGHITNVAVWPAIDVPRGEARSLKLLPYTYAGFDERDGIILDSGLDLKTSLTNEIDLVGSVNPDFRNIENQILSLDFSYFERLAGESRPFFLEGQNYFQTSRDAPLFVTQRIPDFDLGLKTYGKLTDRTTIAVLDTVDFDKRNSFAATVNQSFGPRTNGTFAATDLNARGISNTGTFASINHGFGPYSFFGQHMTTHDADLGDGHRYNTGFGYGKDGIDGVVEYAEVSPDFLPRLGFAPERDFKGYNAFVDLVRPLPTGRLMEYGLTANAWDYKRFSGDHYRSGGFLATSTTLRDGTDIDLAARGERFLGHDDRLYTIDVERPRGDPYRHWQVSYSFGRIDEADYRLLGLGASYRPVKPLQLNLRVQVLDYRGRSDQEILSAYYDLGNDQSISGRAVRTDDDINFYIAFRRSGNLGAEYFLILGDPNARTFRPSLVLKAVFPFDLRF